MRVLTKQKIKDRTIMVTKTYTHTFTNIQLRFIHEIDKNPSFYWLFKNEDKQNIAKKKFVDILENLGVLEFAYEDELGTHFNKHINAVLYDIMKGI